MTRLTNDMRDALALAVMHHRFGDEVKELMAVKGEFAEAVYNDVYTKATREKMAALPDGWLPTRQDISAQFGDGSRYDSLRFDGCVYGVLAELKDPAKKDEDSRSFKIVLYKHAHGCAKAYEPTHKLATRYLALKEREDDLKTRVRAAKAQAKTALNSVSTMASLLKAWPEIEPFARSFNGVQAKLPAIPISALNAIFKLPVQKIAA